MNVPAVVLALTGTGLATVRCLATVGVPVTAVMFRPSKSGTETRWSRRCITHAVDFSESESERLIDWLQSFAGTCSAPPVVIPTSDKTALFLAEHRERLAPYVLTFATSAEDMRRIVNKDGLYQAAVAAEVPIPPMLIEPTVVEVLDWCKGNSPPYIAKPFYGASAYSSLKTKNRVFATGDALARFVAESGSRGVIVQRMIDSGDENICDVYGYCDKDGNVVCMASHGRIRQYPTNTGATSYGEIPFGNDEVDQRAFDLTRKLLRQFRYHGIFGIEWLREKTTGDLFLTDFNARPFSSIGHLAGAGLNLPLLGYLELTTGKTPPVDSRPVLTHSFWMDFNSDIRSFREIRETKRVSWSTFVVDLLRARHFAYFDIRDPGPAIARGTIFLEIVWEFLHKRIRR